MKKILFTIIAAALAFAVTAQETPDKGIQFTHNGWADILARAKKENKLIVLDGYTSWCGPCKWMSKNVFTNDTVAEYYNKTFVCAKIDMEKGEGPELAKRYGVQNYPTLMYINADGDLIHRTCGVDYNAQAPQKFIQDGKNALDPNKQLAGYKRRFETGSTDSKFMSGYINMLAGACMKYDKELDKYFASQKESDLTSRTNWNMINAYEEDAGSKPFGYLMTNYNEFVKLYTKDSVDNKILGVFDASLSAAARKKDEPAFTALKTKLKTFNHPMADAISLQADMDFYKAAADWKKYADASSSYIDKFGKDNADLLNSVAWTFYEKITDVSLLEKAARWSKLSTDYKNIYAYNDTYAAILYKLGKKAEAQAAAEKAIELAKKENQGYKETEELLVKIKLLK